MARPKQNSSTALPHGRKRTLSPGFFQDAELLDLQPLDRLLFAGLWCYCDKAGRVLDKPTDLKIRILPNDAHDVDAALNRLTEKGLLIRYRSGRIPVIAMKPRSWSETQRIHPNEPDSALPPPSKAAARGYEDVLDHQNAPLIPHSEPGETPILSPGSSGPAGPSGPSGSSGPSEGARVSDRQNSDQQDLWLELEVSRIHTCRKLGLQPGSSKKLEPADLNARFTSAVEHLGFVDQGENTRWNQLGNLYEVFLQGKYGRDKSPPWPIELFLSHGVLDTAMKRQRELEAEAA